MRLLWIASTLLPALAPAAEIAVVGTHEGVAPPRSWTRAVEDGLVSRGHEVVPTDVIATRLAGREQAVLEAAFLMQARALADQGAALFAQRDLEAARKVLEEAVRSLQDAARVVRGVDLLWEVHLLLARVELERGDEVAARDAVVAAIALDGARPLDATTAPGELIALHAEELRLAQAELATVSLTTAGRLVTEAWLDGRPVGALPTLVRSVVPGLHHVQARDALGDHAYRAVQVQPGDPLEVRLVVGAPRLVSPADDDEGRREQVRALYRALGEAAGVDAVLLVGREDAEDEDVPLRVQLYDVRSQTFGPAVEVGGAGLPSDVASAVASLVGPASQGPARVAEAPPLALDVSANVALARLLLAAPPPAPTQVTPASAPPLPVAASPTEAVARGPRWPVWLGVGLGILAAAGLGVGLGVGLTPSTGPVSGTIVVDAR